MRYARTYFLPYDIAINACIDIDFNLMRIDYFYAHVVYDSLRVQCRMFGRHTNPTETN